MTNKTEEILKEWEAEAKEPIPTDANFIEVELLFQAENRILSLIRLVRAQREVIEKKDTAIKDFLMDPRLSDANRLYESGARALALTVEDLE